MVLRAKSFVARAGVVGLIAGLLLCVCGAAGAVAAGSPAPTTVARASTPNLITNGKFALPKPFSAQAVEVGSNVQIPGWAVGGNGVIVAATSFLQAPAGVNQSVSLLDQGQGTLTQTVKTTAGTTYLLQWYAAGEPGAGIPAVKSMNVLWNGGVVSARKFNATGHTFTKVGWSLQKVVVTATSASSTLGFADTTPYLSNYASCLVADVSLGADASLYLPTSASLTRTGKLVAVVHNGTGAPLTASGVSVKLYGSWKKVSYAPATTQLMASGPVVNGQAVLQLKLPSSLKGQKISAHATLQGPGYIPVTDKLTIKVT
jgi:hypothetical protein